LQKEFYKIMLLVPELILD